MAKISSRVQFTPLLNPRDVSFENIRNWNIAQAQALANTVQIIESDTKSILLYNPAIESSHKDWTIKLYRITRSYLTKKNKLNKGERIEIKQLTDELGLLIPLADISSVEQNILRDTMNILSQLTADFKYIHLLDSLTENINSENQNKLPLPIYSLLFSVEKYINLVLFSESMMTSIVNLDGWFSHLSPLNSKQLNVQQFLSWFYELTDRVISSNNPVLLEDQEEYHPSVYKLITRYKQSFIKELLDIKKSKSKYFLFSTFPDLKDDLLQLLDLDYNLLMFDRFVILRRKIEIIDHRKINHLVEKAQDEESIISQIGKSLTRKNIVNKVKSMLTFKEVIKDLSLFSNDLIEYEELLNRRSRLSNDEYSRLLEFANLAMNSSNEDYFYQVNQKIEDYQLALCNTISRPFYLLEKIEGKIIPKMNLASAIETDIATNYLKRKNTHEKAESELLNEYMIAIQNIHSKEALQSLVNSIPSFFYISNQRRWNIAIENANEAIRSRSAFRQQKMKELGIDIDTQYNDAQKEVFLTEMLKIEAEIQNFVPFVTSAFKIALPTKRTTEFNAFRHQSDGIEFDPETVFDPEKWIRGNVMKTLKTTIKKGEVTQVNCFCLDLSGSMDHERMRNLYKILYLLVTGIQSRKSFDAFHFFSNSFIPGIEFDYEYTRKNLLFKILTIISKVSGSNIVYTGLAGTNISDGIIGCEHRMNSFVSKLKSIDSEMNLSCSMFVITDGEPSLGIRNLNELKKFVNTKREETGYAIKGIYIKSKDDKKNFINRIFGDEHSAETSSFEEGVQKLTNIMTKTYLQQRQNHKWEKKRKRINSQQA